MSDNSKPTILLKKVIRYIYRKDFYMRKTQYQPTKNKQLTDAQEIHYSKDFKQADIAGGYRQTRVKEAKYNNPELKG